MKKGIWKETGIVEREFSSAIDLDPEQALTGRRATLAQAYAALPSYASPAFWQVLQTSTLPLEVIVRCIRSAVAREDAQSRDRLLELIFYRIHGANQRWAYIVLRYSGIMKGEQQAAQHDLCADLYETLFRALLDVKRPFWEENFMHCLTFERKHVCKAFLLREGFWKGGQEQRYERVPRALHERLDASATFEEGEYLTRDIVDEEAQRLFDAIVGDDLLHLVLQLPERLKAVLLLKFWEGHSEQETARLLGISDRTVRNRIASAAKHLQRIILEDKRENYGERA